MKSVFKSLIFVCVFIIIFLSGLLLFFNFLYPQKYINEIELCAKQYNLEKSLVQSIINVESRYNEKAISNSGAVGLMQILTKTATWIEENEDLDLFNTQTNIQIGCHYIRYLLDEFQDIKLAIAAYNAGPNKVKSWLQDQNCSKNGKTLDNIPYKETENYVFKVLKQKQIYDYANKVLKFF